MKVKYQLVSIGLPNTLQPTIIGEFLSKLDELGVGRDSVELLDEKDYDARHRNNSPIVGLYFGGESVGEFPDARIADDLIDQAAYVIPVVPSLEGLERQVPERVAKINSFRLGGPHDVQPLVSLILEGFSLLRTSRRLFISYKRSDSTGVAIQLYEALARAGFDVFLDTHGVRPGIEFQEELFHRMADTDVVVLLNSPEFMSSFWTTAELAEASGMSIAIVQLVWPGVDALKDSQLTVPISLEEGDFVGGGSVSAASTLAPDVITRLISDVEGLRARALAARQDNLTTEFKRVADRNSVSIDLQPHKYFSITSRSRNKIVIPTIGVPEAFTYNQSDERVKELIASDDYEVHLLYDHKNIKERWLKHLLWLDNHLPVKSFKIVDADAWLTNNA